MSTKDLIKKMKASKDVQPNQLKNPVIKKVKMKDGETVESIIQDELERADSKNHKKSYIDTEIARLRKELLAIEENLDAIRDNMEILMISQREILDFIDELKKAKDKKPSKWKRLFK